MKKNFISLIPYFASFDHRCDGMIDKISEGDKTG